MLGCLFFLLFCHMDYKHQCRCKAENDPPPINVQARAALGSKLTTDERLQGSEAQQQVGSQTSKEEPVSDKAASESESVGRVHTRRVRLTTYTDQVVLAGCKSL